MSSAPPAASPSSPHAQAVHVVLIAEDQELNQLVISKMIERMGHRCQVVAHGQAAIEAAEVQAFGLILMDCMMPVLDGYQATKAIRQAGHPNATTPIVAMTAYAMRDDRDRCIAAGMDDYLSKPVRYQDLVEMVQRWLGSLSGQPRNGKA